PDLSEGRFKLGDPVGQLHHFKILAVVLQIVGANPQRVGNQTAKAAERDGGESEHRRSVFQQGDARKAESWIGALPVEFALQEKNGHQQRGGQAEKHEIMRATFHGSPMFSSPSSQLCPCAVANSRRVKRVMPAAARIPPSSRTICAKAAPNWP